MASNPHNPAMSPHTGTSGYLSHCDNSGKRKKGEVVGEAENKKSSKTENNCLKEKQRPHNALPNIFPNSHYTETT